MSGIAMSSGASDAARMHARARAARASRDAETARAKPGGVQLDKSPAAQTSGNPEVRALGEMVLEWVETMRDVEGRGPATCRSYRISVGRFVRDLDLEAPADVTRATIERHVKRLHYSGIGRSRLATVLIAIRMFCKWLVGHGYLEKNPALDLRPPRPYRRAKRPLTVPEVKRLVLGEGGMLPRDPRELVSMVAFAVAYGAALRPAEIGPLRMVDLEWHEEELMFSVLVRGGKHAHEDVRLPLGRPVSQLLGAYVQLRPQLGEGPFLFPGQGERPLTEVAVRERFTELVERRGIEVKGRKMTPSILRTSRCTHLLRQRHHPKWVQRFMRHASIETTMEHYAWIDENSSVRMLVRGEPLAQKKPAAPAVQGAMRALLEELGGGAKRH